ncbi:hypothetical protein A1Q2_07125 [Trichosporon asahii var. asahii CBS 8904]|uniref:Uncharacterized protein n=1 Tax=Trichosporon asahii var. asahii (strain CBS 8904) TaxID=1220162 RepID=K1V3K4_TRIAC|nr:hypothetical protein A1Q2_07125 [Trichosporon asahii var. asahii CBS 8904]
MASPPKVGFLAPVPRTNVQANVLRTATSAGIIADFQVRKSKIKAYYDYLRNGAPYDLTPEQLADIDLHQRIAMSELNEELDWKIASIYMDSGLPHLLEPAPTTEAAQMAAQAEQPQLQEQARRGKQPDKEPASHPKNMLPTVAFPAIGMDAKSDLNPSPGTLQAQNKSRKNKHRKSRK